MTITHDFSGRTALVTGAASGIGAACAKALDARGIAKLILIDVNGEGLSALDLQCETVLITGSVGDEQLWADFNQQGHTVDHTIVNAGIGAGGTLDTLSMADWRRVMAINLDGAFMTLTAGMLAMPDSGGSAVIVSSSTGVKPIPGTGPYGVSKAAVAHMARIAAAENAAKNIRINAIAPGGVDTAIWEGSPDFLALVEAKGREAAIKTLAKTTPSGRFASSEEMADTILYLLSDAASNITGHVLVTDGGFTL